MCVRALCALENKNHHTRIGRLINIPTDDIRKQICDYLATDKPILDEMKTHDLLELECPHYISQMRHSSTWGGATVQNRRDWVTTTIDRNVTLSWTGGRYEPVSIDLDS